MFYLVACYIISMKVIQHLLQWQLLCDDISDNKELEWGTECNDWVFGLG